MTYMIAYRKHVTREVSRTLRHPVDSAGRQIGTELATVNGLTYVVFDTQPSLPDQPPEIVESIHAVTMTPSLRDELANASPHVRLIRQRVGEMLSDRYSVGDEIKLLRTAPSEEFERYNAYAEECRAWGRGEKAKLGL